ncbi:A-kinase anchoring protein pkaap isoform 2-T5 [Cochliomyia hominivorax]
MTTTPSSTGAVAAGEEDAVSCGALSLGALSNGGGGSNSGVGAASANSIMALNSIVEFDEDLFKYHSRLSMSVTSIVNEPNCLSYFVQFLDKRNALPLIKFYLDTENFKNAAFAQLRKEQKHKLLTQQIPEETGITEGQQEMPQTSSNNDTDDHIMQQQQQQQQQQYRNDFTTEENSLPIACDREEITSDVDSSIVPELKTLCDLTMRKPLTDDEKSQIYAETNKQLTKCTDKPNSNNSCYKTSSELSLCSLASNLTEMSESVLISMASVQDALTIYQKYLSGNSTQRIEIPVDILSKLSLILCKKEMDEENCAITSDCFTEAQHYILNKLEKEFLNDFLQSTYYAKYCVELIQGHNLNINDILHSEVTLFYLMEYLEQQQERDCLDFWSSAINYRKSYLTQEAQIRNEKEAQADAMIIYEKFFSLQNEAKLWSSNKLRSHVEACICTEGLVFYCFDLPLKVAAKYLECKYLKMFLKSSLFANYVNELKTRIEESESEYQESFNKLHNLHRPLRRCVSDKTSNRHRKTLSDCTLDKKLPISQHNTLLASMDQHSSHLKQFQLNIDSSQFTNPDLLWHRSNSNNLKFGRVNSLGRYERDFISPSDALQHTSLKSSHNWSLALNGNKIKNAMRKLVHLPDDNVQEEIAWQVAEMIVKDVTSVTMRQGEEFKGSEHKAEHK